MGHGTEAAMLAVRPVELTPEPALGVLDIDYTAQVVALHPGDRLLLVTDGSLERNAMQVDISTTLATTARQHPRRIVRQLAGTCSAPRAATSATTPPSSASTGTAPRPSATAEPGRQRPR
jgi:hypothetical protein